ncbi:hypothetical protein evm_015000, partial [Chilo suppressalis]
SEVTQITGVAVCNINWPNFMNCSQVTFAVPLVYEDQADDDDPRLSVAELRTMWDMYYNIDPFAARLRRMGVTEFASPDDSSVQAVWMVISVGVVLLTAILGIVLWRYSCVDTYTRMPEPSFRDSGYDEKRGLDLYPTPHQTLPPLYESDYKWSDGQYDNTARAILNLSNESARILGTKAFLLCGRPVVVVNVRCSGLLSSEDCRLLKSAADVAAAARIPLAVVGELQDRDNLHSLETYQSLLNEEISPQSIRTTKGLTCILCPGTIDKSNFNGRAGAVRSGLSHLAIHAGGPGAALLSLTAQYGPN